MVTLICIVPIIDSLHAYLVAFGFAEWEILIRTRVYGGTAFFGVSKESSKQFFF